MRRRVMLENEEGTEMPWSLIRTRTLEEDNVLVIEETGLDLDEMYVVIEQPNINIQGTWAGADLWINGDKPAYFKDYAIFKNINRCINFGMTRNPDGTWFLTGSTYQKGKTHNSSPFFNSGGGTIPVTISYGDRITSFKLVSQKTDIGFPVGTVISIYGR